MFSNNFKVALTLILGLLLTGQDLKAQQMWGSGAYAGQWACPYPTQTSRAATSMSDEENEERERISTLTAELRRKGLDKSRAEREVEYLRRKIERYFDSTVVEFLLDTHIEGNQTCDAYKTSFPSCVNPQAPASAARASGDTSGATDLAGGPAAPAAAASVDCGSKIDVPEVLASHWSGPSGYCAANSRSSAGSVRASICSDASLRPTDAPRYRSYNNSECSKALSDYRKKRIELANAADREERIQQEIEDRQYAIADARERAAIEREYRQRSTESECAECDAAARGSSGPRLQRDWLSTVVNVAGGIGMMYFGRQAERAANEYNAQAGYPSTQSYGYPFYMAGMNGVINGLVGPGAYGCSSTVGGGGFPFGAGGGWNIGGAANGAYGPFVAQGGAFGYPPGMFGSPWGGGAYMPGFGPYGAVNGPYGGFNVGGQFGFPTNGAMCITYPCNVGGMPGMYPGMPGAYGPQFGLQGQFGLGMPGMMPGMPGMYPGMQMPGMYGPQFGLQGQLGMPGMMSPGYPGMMGMNGQLSAQYQMQMLQMQQQMQMQQYQQQQQYYQAALQQQMQQQQQAYQRQQQAMQIQQQMAQLNMQLQMLQMQSYYGTGYSPTGGLSAGFNLGFNVGGGAPMPIGFPGGSPGMMPGMPGALPGTPMPMPYPNPGMPGTPLPGAPGTVPGGGIRGR